MSRCSQKRRVGLKVVIAALAVGECVGDQNDSCHVRCWSVKVSPYSPLQELLPILVTPPWRLPQHTPCHVVDPGIEAHPLGLAYRGQPSRMCKQTRAALRLDQRRIVGRVWDARQGIDVGFWWRAWVGKSVSRRAHVKLCSVWRFILHV